VKQSASTRFKKRLRELRESRGWTQEKAAEACGVGYKLYQLYELGIKRNPGLLTLERIAAGYDLDISGLLAPTFSRAARRTQPAAHRIKRQPTESS
jgi:transcriptional regulator with XRE-family HTH domain